MSGRGRGRGKKANDITKVKNPGVTVTRSTPDDRSTDSSDESSSDDSFENIHEDEAERMEDELEQGELVSEQGETNEDSALLRMSNLLVQIQQNQLETQNRVTELSGQMDASESGTHTWKKEGLRKQYEVVTKVLRKNKLATKSIDNKRPDVAREYIKQGINVLVNRIKDLKIADSSDAGWETVNLYKAHPLAENAADARRIRRAEKQAKERMAEKARRGRQNGRYNNNYNNRRHNNWNNRDDNQRYYQDKPNSSYNSVGSSRSQYNGQRNNYTEQRHDYRRRSSPNDLCFNCGRPGHWQDQCPEKQHRRD